MERRCGVFPKCNLKWTPCYHSRDANHLRVDGPHTREQVAAQMALLRELRRPRAHPQLIGGEVSLLAPKDHAAALTIMRDRTLCDRRSNATPEPGRTTGSSRTVM